MAWLRDGLEKMRVSGVDERVERAVERASARPWYFDGRDIFHKRPGTNLDQIIVPLGQVLSDTFTATGAVNPADIELAVEAVNAYEELLAAVADAEQRAESAEYKLVRGWDAVVAADKARAIKAEIRAELAEQRADKAEAVRHDTENLLAGMSTASMGWRDDYRRAEARADDAEKALRRIAGLHGVRCDLNDAKVIASGALAAAVVSTEPTP